MKTHILLPILICGFSLGYTIKEHVRPTPSEQMVNLFEEVCLSVFTGKPFPEFKHEQRLDTKQHPATFFDQNTNLSIQFHKNGCNIVDEVGFTNASFDADAMLSLLEKIIAEQLPALSLDTGFPQDLGRGWFRGKRETRERWGVVAYVPPSFPGPEIMMRYPIDGSIQVPPELHNRN